MSEDEKSLDLPIDERRLTEHLQETTRRITRTMPEEMPEEVREGFVERLKAALRGDDEAAREFARVVSEADKQQEEEGESTHDKPAGFLSRTYGMLTGGAGWAWQTFTSWKRTRDLVVGAYQTIIIETLNLVFKTLLVVPLGVKLTGDTALRAAYVVKAVLYHLNGQSIPRSEIEAMGDYVDEVRRVTGYLSSLGLRAGLFAIPGIGAIAAATVGKYLEGKIKESFGDDPEVIGEIQALIPK